MKNRYFDMKKLKNDIDLLAEIKNAFGTMPYIRKRDLIAKLSVAHQNIVGYSKVTLERKINDLCDDKILIRIYYGDIQKFGIKETDKKAVYLLFKETTKIKEHINNVLKLLDSDKSEDIQLVLTELDAYRQRYILDGTQLDKFVEKLQIKDDKLRYSIFMLLFGEINKGVEPTDIIQTKGILHSLLKVYSLDSYKQHSIRSLVIELLGHYSDSIVVTQLIKDATTLNENYSNDIFNYLTETYCNPSVAKLVEENRTKLFNLEKRFRNENKEHSAGLISWVRSSAIRNLDQLEYTKQKPYLKSSWQPSALR